MKRNIVDLRPDVNMVLDVDMIFAISVTHENDEWVMLISSQGAPQGLHIHFKGKEDVENVFKKLSDGMIQ